MSLLSDAARGERDNMRQNETQNTELTKPQVRVIPFLLETVNITAAARKAKTSRATIYRWLDSNVFRDELRRQRRMMADLALDAIRSHIGHAADTLVGLLDSASDAVRRGAARDLIDLAIRVNDLQDVEQRLQTPEEQIERTKS